MCWFVSKKKYDAMVAERDKWDGIAAESIKLCQEFREHAARWEELACSCREDNKRLIDLEGKMLARIKELEADLQRARRDNQQWAEDFEELDIAYGQLEIERDHYKERVEAFEEGMYLTREAE